MSEPRPDRATGADRRHDDSDAGTPPGPLAGGKRRCGFCLSTVPPLARRCAQCGEILDENLASVNDSVIRFGSRLVLDEMKENLNRWYRAKFISAGVIGLGLTLFFGFGLHSVLASLVEKLVTEEVEAVATSEAVADAIRAQVAQALPDVRQLDDRITKLRDTIENTQAKLSSVQGALLAQLLEPLRLETARLAAETVRYTDLSNMLQPTALRTVADGLRDSRISLRQPVSLFPERPTTVFVGEPDAAQSVTFQWTYAGEPDERLSFDLQWSRTPTFEQREQRTTVFLAHNEPIRAAGDADYGTYYWRVRRHGDGLWSDTASFELFKSALHRIERSGRVLIGISSQESGRFSFNDGDELGGFDIAIAREITESLGQAMARELSPRFVRYDWIPLLTAPAQREVDFVISTITIRPERETDYGLLFSRPYHETSSSFVRLKANGTLGVADLNGATVVAQRQTTGLQVAQEIVGPKGQIVEVDTAIEIFRTLRTGLVVAAVTDLQLAQDQLTEQKLADFEAVPLESHVEKYGIAVAANERALCRRIDAAIVGLQAYGKLDELRKLLDKR